MIKVTRALYLLMLSAPVWGQAVSPVPVQDADQSQPPVLTLKVVTGLVAISAVVRSKDGETKTGLTKDDFVLKQDGKEEPIRFFSRGSDLPLSLALLVDTSASQQTFIGDEALASDAGQGRAVLAAVCTLPGAEAQRRSEPPLSKAERR